MEFNATFIVAFVSFIVFIIIMNQILYKPISDIVEKRQKLIDENYEEASKNQEKSKAILDDRLDKLNNARSRVREETALALEKAKEDKRKAQEDAKASAGLKIEQSVDALNQDKQNAINTLKNDVINLAQIISDKFIESDEKISQVDDETIDKIMQD